MDTEQRKAFEKAGQAKSPSLITEFLLFIKLNKKFWFIPLLLAFLLIGTLILLGGTSIAPFIYTLF